MFRFAEPSYLIWFWLFMGLAVVLVIYDRWQRARFQKYFGRKLGPFLTASVSVAKRRWKIFIQCLALGFFALALARPQMGMRQDEIKQQGIEIILALDVSNSMLAEDDKPSRLQHAKHELSRFLDKLNGDKVGLIAFAGTAVLITPLTSDYAALKMFLEGLSPESVSNQGTNFRAVIETAMKAFDRGGVENENGIAPTRVIVFASDGEETDERPMGGIDKKALDAGIRVFGLGFGSGRGAPIPLRDDRGNLTGYKKDRSGQTVMSIPSDEFMGKLARQGGGGYYHATFEETEVSSLLQDLSKLQKAEYQSKLSVTYDEKFQIPLLIGLILAFFDMLLGTRRAASRFWRGRFEVAR